MRRLRDLMEKIERWHKHLSTFKPTPVIKTELGKGLHEYNLRQAEKRRKEKLWPYDEPRGD